MQVRERPRVLDRVLNCKSPYLPAFHARSLHVVQETAPAALIAPPVVQAALWTRASRAALVLLTLRFPAVDVAAVLSYFCHIGSWCIGALDACPKASQTRVYDVPRQGDRDARAQGPVPRAVKRNFSCHWGGLRPTKAQTNCRLIKVGRSSMERDDRLMPSQPYWGFIVLWWRLG